MDRDAIVVEVRRQVGEPSSGGYWSGTYYANAFLAAQKDLSLEIPKSFQGLCYFLGDGTNKVFDIGDLSLADFLDIHQVLYYHSGARGTGAYDVIVPTDRNGLSAAEGLTDATSGVPTFFCFEDRQIEFDTIPANGKYIYVYYWKAPVAPAGEDAGSDDLDVADKFHQAYVSNMCWKFCESDESNAHRVMYFKGEYYRDLGLVRKMIEPPGTVYEGIKDDTRLPFYG